MAKKRQNDEASSARKRGMRIPASNWSEKLWEEIITKLTEARSRKEVKEILEKLISDDERVMIMRRLATLALVKSGHSYRKISEALWLSPNTISTVKKNAKGGFPLYKSYTAFYRGPRKWSEFAADRKKSQSDALLELIAMAGKVFEPFMKRGLGITGKNNYRYHR